MRCPICGDPNAYPVWLGKEQPTGCIMGDHVQNVTQCEHQMGLAKDAAARRKFCPEAFDESGKMKSGGWGVIAEKAKRIEAETGRTVVIGSAAELEERNG